MIQTHNLQSTLAIETKINEKIKASKKLYGEEKLHELIDMTNEKVRTKALDKIMYHHAILRNYIMMIAGKDLFLYYEQNKPDSANIVFATKGEELRPRLVYCDIMLTESVFEVKSDIIELTLHQIWYIKRIIYLSAIGQI